MAAAFNTAGVEALDMILSASWPGALAPPSRLRPDPPRAPRRGPATANWSVPPLSLPVVPPHAFKAPRKHSPGGETSTGLGPDEAKWDSESEDDNDLQEEVCIFDLDGDAAVDEDLDFGNFKSMISHDSDFERNVGFSAPPPARTLFGQVDGGGSASANGRSRLRTESVDSFDSDKGLSLGASPVLLSVLEQIAYEAQSSMMMRQRTA